MDVYRGDGLYAGATARSQNLFARGLLVLPLAICSAGDGRDAALGAGERGRRIFVRHTASVWHPAYWPRSHPGRAEIQRRMAFRAFLESASTDPRLNYGAIPRPVRRAEPGGQAHR